MFGFPSKIDRLPFSPHRQAINMGFTTAHRYRRPRVREVLE